MTMQPAENVWLDPHKAAAYCGCHRETIRRAFRAGALQALRIGRTLRMRREWLDAWIVAGGRTSAPTRVRANGNRRPLTPDDTDCGADD